MEFEISEQELMDEAGKIALQLRFLTHRHQALPGQIIARAAEFLERMADELPPDGHLDPVTLEWAAQRLRHTPLEVLVQEAGPSA